MVWQGLQSEVKRLIMFFRTDAQLITVFNFLREELGVFNTRTAPFVMYTSSTIGQTDLVIAVRAGKLPTILATQALKMGMNVPKKDVVIFSRPPDTGHSLLQGMHVWVAPAGHCLITQASGGRPWSTCCTTGTT